MSESKDRVWLSDKISVIVRPPLPAKKQKLLELTVRRDRLKTEYQEMLADRRPRSAGSTDNTYELEHQRRLIDETEQEIAALQPVKKQANRLQKGTNALKILHSSKWLQERRAFENEYNKAKKRNSSASVASIIRQAKKRYPKTIGVVPDSTIRKWIKKS